MARSGRKAKPLNLRLVDGSAAEHPERINEEQPKPKVEAPPCPEYLTDPEERRWFDHYAELLAGMRIMSRADTEAIASLAKEWKLYLEADTHVRESGLMVRSPNNHPIQNPYLAIRNRAWERVWKLLGDYGLTQASRNKVSQQ